MSAGWGDGKGDAGGGVVVILLVSLVVVFTGKFFREWRRLIMEVAVLFDLGWMNVT